MFQAYLLDDPRYRQCDDLKDLAAAIEAYVPELGRTSARRKLVRVLVTVGDLEGEARALKPELALMLDRRPAGAGRPAADEEPRAGGSGEAVLGLVPAEGIADQLGERAPRRDADQGVVERQ